MKQIIFLLFSTLLVFSAAAEDNVDTRIPLNTEADEKTFVLVIANEHYKHVAPVQFANNDGEVFTLYCEKTLGIPSKQIHYIADATKGDMEHECKWLRTMMETYKGEARAIVFYSGHGMPDEDNRQSYLLPVDARATDVSSCFGLKAFYEQLSEMPSKATLVFLDACFSGARRDGNMLVEARSVAIKPKEFTVAGNMVVFAAAQGSETAYPYKEKQHGIFTYYLLKKIQEKGGKVSLGELGDELTKQVGRTAPLEMDGKTQTPTVTSTAADWRSWKLTERAASKTFNRILRKKEEEQRVPISTTSDNNTSTVREAYVIEGEGTGVQGTYLVSITLTSKEKTVSDDKFVRCAIHGVLFRGFTSSAHRQRQRPLAGSIDAEAQHGAFFAEFFEDAYRNYGHVIEASRRLMRVGKEHCITAVVCVDKDQLRKVLQEKGIVKSLNSGF